MLYCILESRPYDPHLAFIRLDGWMTQSGLTPRGLFAVAKYILLLFVSNVTPCAKLLKQRLYFHPTSMTTGYFLGWRFLLAMYSESYDMPYDARRQCF